MSVATRGNVDRIFGKANVEKWADLNNTRNPKELELRYSWALELADAEVYSRLRDGPYAVPFTAPYDPVVVDLAARVAGLLMFDGRRVSSKDDDDDGDMGPHHKKVDLTVRRILAGIIRLDVTTQAVNHPQNISVT
jgi:hypothetical protein